MHTPTTYEIYLNNYLHTYCWEDGENRYIPDWLRHEFNVYFWMFEWSRTMYSVSKQIPKKLWDRMKNITSNSHGKYINISPNLTSAVRTMTGEIHNLYLQLTLNEEMLEGERTLTEKGQTMWRAATERISKCKYVEPEIEWREEQERKRCFPYCTMKEAESIALAYVHDVYHISIEDDKYYHFMTSKNNIFKMAFGKWDDKGCFDDFGELTIDMKTHSIIEDHSFL